jgi:non-canonical (house-cleaning) NTP pyrophosphatase
MKIIVWTTNPAKVKAIEEAISKCVYFEWKNIEITTLKVPSDVSDMPKTLEENINWARNRALNCKKEVTWDLYIWMEGWTNIVEEKAYLFWVVYILNNDWVWHFWISNMMEVPSIFQKRIYENNEILWNVLEELTWIVWASKKNWAFGAWSDNLLTRKDQFVLAFLSAIPGFYNNFYKI